MATHEPPGTAVLIVEDDPDLLLALSSGLSNAGYSVCGAADLRTASQRLSESTFACVLVDLGLPDGSGLSLVRTLHETHHIPSLVISARSLEAQKVQALDLGADDYLVKPFGIGELLARIRVLLRRQTAAEVTHHRLGDIEIDADRRRVLKGTEEVHLSPIEYGLLLELVRANGRLVPHRKLLNAIWGPEAVHETHYLRVYMGKLRAKLEENPTAPRLILTELGVGYRANL
ncbi:MAG: hypothetical protein RLZZ290_1811 [Pseudomonadota bacterium]|jgi:two-component system KDP operon response regulator KdpE